MRDTAGQDRQLAQRPAWHRHRRLIIAGVTAVAALLLLSVWLLRFSGINSSVDRSRLTIASVERGLFVRDVAADGQVVAASSPTLVCHRIRDHCVARACRRCRQERPGAGGDRQPRSHREVIPGAGHPGEHAGRLAARAAGCREQTAPAYGRL